MSTAESKNRMQLFKLPISIAISSDQRFFLWTLSVMSVLMWIAYHLLPITFGANDDVAMLLITSGYVTGTPEPKAFFIHILLGHLLASLYSTFPHIEWYALHFALAQVVALSTLLFVFMKEVKETHSSFWQGFVYVVAVFAMAIHFVLRVEFTTLSFTLSAAGYLLLYRSLQAPKPTLRSTTTLLSVCLLIWALLIRAESFFGASLLLGCFFVYPVTAYKLRLGAMLVCTLGIVWGIHHMAYSTPAWKFYTEYNQARSLITPDDNPYARALLDPKQVQETPVPRNTISLYQDYFPVSEMSIDMLHQLGRLIPQNFLPPGQLVASMLHTYWRIFLLLGALLVLFLSEARTNWQAALAIVAFVAICLLLAANNTMKDRVVLGLYFTLIVFSFYVFIQNHAKTKPLTKALQLAFAIGFTLLFTRRFLFFNTVNQASKQQLEQQLHCLRSNYVYVPIGAYPSLEALHPFEVSERMDTLQMVFTGWMLGSPIHTQQVQRYFEIPTPPQGEVFPFIEYILIENSGNTRLLSKRFTDLIPYVHQKGITLEKEGCHTAKLYRTIKE